MKATDILTSEHRIIEDVLYAVETAAERAKAGEHQSPEFFLKAAEFISGFADGCHHRKEEGVLFKMLEEHGMPITGSPVGVMLHEHAMARDYTQSMREAAEQWEAGDISARVICAENALDYVALLRQHILKEDQILFPMAGNLIPQSEWHLVEEGFEHVEHEETGEGIHEKYLAIAEDLRHAALAPA